LSGGWGPSTTASRLREAAEPPNGSAPAAFSFAVVRSDPVRVRRLIAPSPAAPARDGSPAARTRRGRQAEVWCSRRCLGSRRHTRLRRGQRVRPQLRQPLLRAPDAKPVSSAAPIRRRFGRRRPGPAFRRKDITFNFLTLGQRAAAKHGARSVIKRRRCTPQEAGDLSRCGCDTIFQETSSGNCHEPTSRCNLVKREKRSLSNRKLAPPKRIPISGCLCFY
jgi:hypothetical protein